MKSMNDIFINEIDEDTIITFGKYKGETFKYVLEVDKNYLKWLFTKTDFCDNNNIADDLMSAVLE